MPIPDAWNAVLCAGVKVLFCKAEIGEEAWESLRSAISRPFPRPRTGRIAVKVINHLGDEVMNVFSVPSENRV